GMASRDRSAADKIEIVMFVRFFAG
ncbi:MAG: hypothetical protein RL112_1364, partial [Planctomycetota bacterium]